MAYLLAEPINPQFLFAVKPLFTQRTRLYLKPDILYQTDTRAVVEEESFLKLDLDSLSADYPSS